jgi:TonB-linked SusC/RagA family outer membrane protein
MRVVRQILLHAVLLAGVGWSTAQAQARGSVTGLVSNEASGRPLGSAQVFIQGTGLGGITSANGRYLIANVPVGTHTLRVQLIGFSAAEQQVTVTEGQAVTVNLTLSEEALALDEIVVTGTAGQARQREVGNQIAQVKTADVLEPVKDVASLLQGRTAGSRIAVGAGGVASGPDIRLRGNVSSALSNQPLIYIDGQRMQSEPITTAGGAETPYSPLNDLNPDDIDRIEIVKGPAATTLYGTEAAAGVIQIFTKRGGQGAPVWTAEMQHGVSYIRPLGPEVEWLRGVPEVGEALYRNARYTYLNQVFCDSPFNFTEINPNPRCSGHQQRYSMSVRGGTPDLGYFVSGAYQDDQGAVETESQERFNLRANTTFRPREDLLVQFNNSLSQADFQQAQMGNSITSIMMTAVRGSRNYMSGQRDQETLRLLLDGDQFTDDITRVTSGLTLTYTPGSDFTHRLTVGYDYAQDDHQQAQDFCWLCPIGKFSDESDYVAGGELWRRYSKTVLSSFDYVGTLGFNVSSGIRSTLSFGAQAVQTEKENGETVGRHFPGPGEYTLSTAATRWDMGQRKVRVITGGFFAQDQLGFADRYFLTLGVRVDGNSAFGEDLGFEIYPKVSGSWVLSDEGFWPESFGQVKLRGALGFAGRAPGAFDKVRTWSANNFGSGSLSFSPQNRGNDALGPERTSEMEVGFDAGWFGGRLSADFTYFRQRTTDALFEVAVPNSEGGWNDQLQNVGEVQNQGVEINTNATLISTRSFRWELGLGLGTNNSKVLDLGGTAPFSVGSSGWVFEGQPLPVIYDDRLLNPYEKADPEFSDGPVFFGPANPNRLYTASTTLGLPGGLQFSARGELSLGGHIFNNFESNALSRTVPHVKCYEAYHKADPTWEPGGDTGTNNQPSRPASRPADMYAWEWAQCFGQRDGGYNMQSSDYFELRDVTLTVPVSSLLPSVTTWASRVDLTVSGRNVAKWLNRDLTTGHPEQDENNSGTTGGEFRHDFVRAIQETLPPTSSFTVSLRVTF